MGAAFTPRQQSESESGGGGRSEGAKPERHGGTRTHAWI